MTEKKDIAGYPTTKLPEGGIFTITQPTYLDGEDLTRFVAAGGAIGNGGFQVTPVTHRVSQTTTRETHAPGLTAEALDQLNRVLDPNNEGVHGFMDPASRSTVLAILARMRELQAVASEAARSTKPSEIFLVHVYDAADNLIDYYPCQTREAALGQAAADVVAGHHSISDHFNKAFSQTDRRSPEKYSAVTRKTREDAHKEPGGIRRWHVQCGEWRAHVDALEMLP